MTTSRSALIAAALPLVLSAAVSCSPRTNGEPPAVGGTGGASAAAAAPIAGSDTARLERLEGEARALAKVEGCGAAAQCRTAPVGSRPCGGPRDYLAYCAATTDSAALFRALDELARAEKEYNRASGAVSTCEFRMPPAPTVAGGRCTATAGVP